MTFIIDAGFQSTEAIEKENAIGWSNKHKRKVVLPRNWLGNMLWQYVERHKGDVLGGICISLEYGDYHAEVVKG